MTVSFQSFCRCSRLCNEQKRKTSSCPQSWCLSWSSGTSLLPCHWTSIHMLSCVKIKAVTNSTTLLESEEIWPATLVEIICEWVPYDVVVVGDDVVDDDLCEPLVEVEVLPGHGPDQVHTVLLCHVIDVAQAGVVLHNVLCKPIALVCLFQDARPPAQCSSRRSRWCWGGTDHRSAKSDRRASRRPRCGSSGKTKREVWQEITKSAWGGFCSHWNLVGGVDDHPPRLLSPPNPLPTNHHLVVAPWGENQTLPTLLYLFSQRRKATSPFLTCIRASRPPSGLSMFPEIGAARTFWGQISLKLSGI